MIALYCLAAWYLMSPHHVKYAAAVTDVVFSPFPVCDAVYGFPRYCLGLLILFDRVIADRGYSMDELVEFLYPGETPQHSIQYPREELLASKYTFWFQGNPLDEHQVCVMTFDMAGFWEDRPASLVMTHATLRKAASNIMDVCCYGVGGGTGGFRTVMKNANSIIQCDIYEASSFDENLQDARKITMEYKPLRSNKELSMDPTGGFGQSEASGTGKTSGNGGGSGPVGVDDKGKAAASYCNKAQQPTTCLPGLYCLTKALAN